MVFVLIHVFRTAFRLQACEKIFIFTILEKSFLWLFRWWWKSAVYMKLVFWYVLLFFWSQGWNFEIIKCVPCNKSDILFALSAEVTDEVCLSCCSVFYNHKHLPWLVYEILESDAESLPYNCNHEVLILAVPAIHSSCVVRRVRALNVTSYHWTFICHYGL